MGRLEGHEAYVVAVAFAPDGRRLVTGSWDRTVRVWDAATGRCLKVLRGHDGLLNAVAFAAGDLVASGDTDRTAVVWDVETSLPRFRLPGHGNPVVGVQFDPEGRYLATASTDRSVRLFDLADGVERARFDLGRAYPVRIAFGPEGRFLAAGLDDGSIRLWKIDDQALLWPSGSCVSRAEERCGLSLGDDFALIYPLPGRLLPDEER